MSAVQSNVTLGREVELYNRVLNSDPTNAVFTLVVLATGGDTLNDLRDHDTLAAVLAGPSNEVTNAGYSRIEFDNTDLVAYAVDDTNNQILLDLPLATFGGPNIAAGDVWDIGLVCYDPDSTGGTDSAIIPITAHELRIDGTAIPGIGQPIIWDLSSGWVLAK